MELSNVAAVITVGWPRLKSSQLLALAELAVAELAELALAV